MFLFLDNARNGVNPPVTPPTDSGSERFREARGRGTTGGPARHAAPAQGSGPNSGSGIQPPGEEMETKGFIVF